MGTRCPSETQLDRSLSNKHGGIIKRKSQETRLSSGFCSVTVGKTFSLTLCTMTSPFIDITHLHEGEITYIYIYIHINIYDLKTP